MLTEKEKKELFDQISNSIVEFNEGKCIELCNKVIAEKLDTFEAITQGLTAGMAVVGEYYQSGKYFVPELLLCSDALYAGLDILQPHLKEATLKKPGKIILGVVEGDIHDIGKSLVKGMFVAAGWEVHDLGRDVPCERFIRMNQEIHADVIGLSALMTTSMLAMQDVIKNIRKTDPGTKVMVGGAPLTGEIADKYNADGYAPDAVTAVKEAERLILKADE